ncbi:MAG TPA: 50S ribosomal protein L3 [bacterium]|nr:50S ribosomal protein L3 [bacterium]
MAKFLLGIKQNMTQVFDESGKVFPATLVSAGPIVVTQIKNREKDGYEAVQFGFGERKEKNIKKPQKKLGNFKYVREFFAKNGAIPDWQVGNKIDVSVFQGGDNITVSGISKGKGFQGVVKRHGFHGGPASHGQKHSLREPGSIGSTGPQKVFKGTKMAGRMGADRITVKGLKIVKVNKEKNLLYISGAVPGHRGTLLEIRG